MRVGKHVRVFEHLCHEAVASHCDRGGEGSWRLRLAPATTRRATEIVAGEWTRIRAGAETLSRDEMREALTDGTRRRLGKEYGSVWLILAWGVARIIIEILLATWWSD